MEKIRLRDNKQTKFRGSAEEEVGREETEEEEEAEGNTKPQQLDKLFAKISTECSHNGEHQ